MYREFIKQIVKYHVESKTDLGFKTDHIYGVYSLFTDLVLHITKLNRIKFPQIPKTGKFNECL